MDKNVNIKVLNTVNKQGMLPMLFGELVSADALTNAEQCKKSLEILNDFKEALPETEIEDKDTWMKFIDDGLEIVKRDLENFERKLD